MVKSKNSKEKLSKRASKKKMRPKEIIDSGLKIFSRDGFSGARLEDVAKHAKISKGTIYLYFKNKEELFRACVRETVAKPIEESLQLEKEFEGATEELIRALGEKFAAIISRESYRTIMFLLISESQRFPELAKFYFEEVIAPALEVLKKLLFRGVHRGELKETVINNQPMLLMSPVIYSLVWNKLFGVKEQIDIRKVSMDHLNIILEGLRVDGPNNPGKTIRSDEKK